MDRRKYRKSNENGKVGFPNREVKMINTIKCQQSILISVKIWIIFQIVETGRRLIQEDNIPIALKEMVFIPQIDEGFIGETL